MDNFIFKGISSESFNVIVNSLPPISKPAMRVEETEIDGLDGTIFENLGYGSYEKKIEITITKNNIDDLIGWLNGEGDLVLSNEPDKYYKAKVIEQIDFARLIKYEPVEVTFRVQPFKYEYQEKATETEEKNVEGSNIQITDGKVIELQIDGKCEQETRSGKNLYNVEIDEKTDGGITYSLKNNILKVNGTRTSGGNLGVTKPITYKANTSYTCSVKILKGSLNFSDKWGSQITFGTIDNQAKYITLYDVQNNSNKELNITFTPTTDTTTDLKFWFGYDDAWTEKTFNNIEASIQIEEGSVATEFEQYGASPSPDYPSEIKTIPSIRNLFDKDNANLLLDNVSINAGNGLISSTNGFYSLVIDCKPNTTYTVSKEVSARFCLAYSTNDSVNVGDTLTVLNSNHTGTKLSGTTGNDAKKLFVMYSKASEETITKQELLDSIMIEEGSIVHDYVPYGAWEKVKVTGKNLIDDTKIKNGYTVSDNNGSVVYDASYVNNRFASEQYIKTYNGMKLVSNYNIVNYGLYDKDKNFISRVLLSGQKEITITNDGFIRVSFLANDTSLVGKVQLEENPNPTEYEPYKEKEVLIDLKGNELCSIGDIKDTLDIVDGQVVIDKKIGKVVLDGSETWNKVNSAFQTTVETTPNKGAVYLDAYSNYFKHTYHATGITTQIQDGTFGWNSGKVLTIRNDNCSTATDFKTWLSENNVTVYYELATPETISLGTLDIPNLFEGVNHISNIENANMIIDYIDNKLIADNLGNHIAKPIIDIEGSGTIKFILNGNSLFSYTFPDGENTVTIDSQKQDAYLGSTLKNRNMSGEFPIFEIGENIITWEGAISSIEITSKSRWL